MMMQRFINITDYNSGQRLDNVNQTHLVLASGKLVHQKRLWFTLTMAQERYYKNHQLNSHINATFLTFRNPLPKFFAAFKTSSDLELRSIES